MLVKARSGVVANTSAGKSTAARRVCVSGRKALRTNALFGGFFSGATKQSTGSGASTAVIGRAPNLHKKDRINFDEVGFRYDPANNRWLRDDRNAGKFDEEVLKAKPMSGSAYVVWPVMHTYLVAKGLRSVNPQQALDLLSKGWMLVDVRVDDDYDRDHAAGAINLPLYRPVQGKGVWDTIKRGVMAVGFAMRATERDPEYRQKIQEALSKGTKIIVMCSIGGTLDTLLDLRKGVKPAIPDEERAFGRESRSLKAAYEFMQAGWTSSNILFMEGGLNQWRHDKLPME